MSAIVCGKRSTSIFEDLPAASPPVSKRIRCSSSSPVRYSPTRASNPPPQFISRLSLVDHLKSIFPEMDKQVLERTLENCHDDLDSAIKSLNDLQLGSINNNIGLVVGKYDGSGDASSQIQSQGKNVTGMPRGNGEDPSADNTLPPRNITMSGEDWVEHFVREMMSASSMDDAKARASRALEVLEKSIIAHAGPGAAKDLHQENSMLKEQIEALIQENAILKRAVSIQHERQKEYEDRSNELQNLRQLVSQYQEQLRTLEVNNYALAMHLRQAQQSNSITGHFHPDVF